MTLPTILLGLLALVGCVGAITALSKLASASAQQADALRRADDAERENHDLRARLTQAHDRLSEAQQEAATLTERVEHTREAFRQEGQRSREHIERIEQQYKQRAEEEKQELESRFKALASEALAASKKDFFDLAKQTFESHKKDAARHLDEKSESFKNLIKPIDESLKKTHERLEALDKSRAESHTTLSEQLRHFAEDAGRLRKETGNLVNALRKPQVRGRYGEIQLERVVELAGMRSYCDFTTQSSTRDDTGALLRPDLVVSLPNRRSIVVDAKTNIEAYLDAINADDPDEADRHLERFARHMAEQAGALSKKSYWAQYDGSPEFVVMFVPGDQFVDAALQRRPDLLDYAAEHRVIIASPSTLVGLLRAVHVGWRERQLSESARELFDLGKELHKRTAKVLEHAEGLGKSITDAQERYNRLVGSVDSRLLPTLRKFEDKGAKSSEHLTELKKIDGTTRALERPAGDETALIEPKSAK